MDASLPDTSTSLTAWWLSNSVLTLPPSHTSSVVFKPRPQDQQTQPAKMSSEAAPDLANAASPSDSASPEPTENAPTADGRSDDKSKKRAAPNDGAEQPHKVTKRRAARACVSCRARKVRCDVVEGAPCGNCRWDNVEVRAARFASLSRPFHRELSVTDHICFLQCIVQESRRRK